MNKMKEMKEIIKMKIQDFDVHVIIWHFYLQDFSLLGSMKLL